MNMNEQIRNKKAPHLSEAFLEEVWVLLLGAGPKGLEPSTSGLTGKRTAFNDPVNPNI